MMRLAALVLAIAALVANIGIGLIYDPGDELNPGTGDDPSGDDWETSDIQKVRVPEFKIGDQGQFSYEIFAQLYTANKSSGEWDRYTLTGDGQLLEYVDDLEDAKDGYRTFHRCQKIIYETRANFNMKIEGNDKDPVNVPGQLDVERAEYNNVFDHHVIMSMNHGTLEIEGLGGAYGDIPADVSYVGDLRSYPDPAAEVKESLLDVIYAKGQELTLDSHGKYEPAALKGEDMRAYDWNVDGAFVVKEHDTFKVNITTQFWGFFDYQQYLYISPDFSFPLKGYVRSNASYEDENQEFYIIIEEKHVITSENSVRRGDRDITWGSTAGHNEYFDRHPAGEYERWTYVPADGSDLDRSSFNGFTMNDAVDFAMANSEGVNDFLDEFESRGVVLASESRWNTSIETKLAKNTTKYWNLTFSYVYDHDEIVDHWERYGEWPEWRYRLAVAESVEERPFGDVEVARYIARDEGDDHHGRIRGGTDGTYLQVNSEVLTLTHSEKIMRIDPEVKENGFENNKLTNDVAFTYSVEAVNPQNNPGMELISQLTGIQAPTANNAYLLQNGQVWTSGATFTAAVDANSGRMIYVMSIEGSQLASIFGK